MTLGTPNACNRCHANREARWADSTIRAWYREPTAGFQRFAGAFAADEQGEPGAADSLVRVFADTAQPTIVRASALARLARYLTRLTASVTRRRDEERTTSTHWFASRRFRCSKGSLRASA